MLLTAANDWAKYIGHFHPVIVHLPIGILFIALLLEVIAWKYPSATSPDPAIEVCLAAGFISAVLACFLGWFLSFEGGYNETTLLLHQYMGMGVAALAGVCWIFKKKYALRGKLNRLSLLLLILLVTVTGHFGGNMTHGDDYLTAAMPSPVSDWLGISKITKTAVTRKPIANIREAVVYSDLVMPVLGDKCFSCHSSKKVKGALRMDTEELLFKGGKHGAVIKKGDPAGSELIIRLLLPGGDDKRMPPKDQPPVTKEEIALLQWWIKTGADTKKKVKDLPADAPALAMLASFGGAVAETGAGTGGGRGDGSAAGAKTDTLSGVYSDNPPAAGQADIDALASLGILVSPVAKDKNLLEVSCINYTAFDNRSAALLTKLAGNIVWLRLDNTAITDDALAQIGQLKKLVRLNLAETKISSAGIAKLQQLSNLEYINIINTGGDDAGLAALSAIKSLKSVYCWNSLITQKGMESFKRLRPSVRLESGE